MGRVWRQGQIKEVFIYRLLSKGTVEESILRRQREKSLLYSVVEDLEAIAEDDSFDAEFTCDDLKHLVYPSDWLMINNTSKESSGCIFSNITSEQLKVKDSVLSSCIGQHFSKSLEKSNITEILLSP